MIGRTEGAGPTVVPLPDVNTAAAADRGTPVDAVPPVEDPAAPVRTAATPVVEDRRRYDIELLRIVASVAVIVLHTAGLLFPVETKNPLGGAAHWVALSGDTLGRFAVPAFFAISGWAVLVASPPKSGSILMRRVVRVIVPMAVWTIVYLLWSLVLPATDPTLTGQLGINALFGSVQPAFHMWYLYGYIPLIILLGCVQLAVSGRSLRLAGVVLLFFAVLPTIATPVLVLTGVVLPRAQWGPAFYQIAYAVGGAVLLARPLRLRLVVLIPLHVLAFVAVLWWEHTILAPAPYGTVAVTVYTATSILLITRIRVPLRVRAFVRRLADASFGVYLVHILLLQAVLTWWADPHVAHPYPGLWLAAVAGTVVVVSFVLSLAWGRVGWRKILG